MKNINIHDFEYLSLLDKVYTKGVDRKDRTGVGTRSIFGTQSTYYMDTTFPILTTKKIHFKSVVHELLWMLSGSTNTEYLKNNGISIWDEWADEKGELGPIYGKQWRDFEGVDQIKKLIDGLIADPFSRRHIVSAWNPKDLPDMALAPCHAFFQFYVHEKNDEKYLSCHLYQRSADLFLGVPFNISSYSLLTTMIAHVVGMKPYKLIHSIGDAHIYLNHFEHVEKQLNRSFYPASAKIILNSLIDNIFNFSYNDIILVDYDSHPAIKAPIAI